MRIFIIVLALMTLAGCGRHINTRNTDRIISVEKSLKYREGFAHGCKKEKINSRHKDYHVGWEDGNKHCKKPSSARNNLPGKTTTK